MLRKISLFFSAMLKRLGMLMRVIINVPQNIFRRFNRPLLPEDTGSKNQNPAKGPDESKLRASTGCSATAFDTSAGEDDLFSEITIISIKQMAERQSNLRGEFIQLQAGELVELEVVVDSVVTK